MAAQFRCDLCGGEAMLADATLDARKLLSAVARSGQRFGAAHLADILTGTMSEAIRRQNHDGSKPSASATTAESCLAGD